MVSSDESFLPQIVGLFYATFDPKLGPTVLHQVPENLISRTSSDERSRSVSREGSSSRPSSPSTSTLLNFAPISEYVIPKKSLHGKLVTLLTIGEDEHEYRVMGFPSVLTGEGGRYQRNEYMWNMCFVFYASSSLEAFEPVVRKCARILSSAELDSAYLSSPAPEHTSLPAVLEQLFEDLNSYSETSISLDGFNSLELKLFPFFPNPLDCEDWHVPIALVDLNALKDDNWDITAARVAEHIDGVNHVRKIAQLADADPALTRETLRHMLYYQVVMMVDIFQYSNMYTLKPSISRLASDETVFTECAQYVTRPHFPHPSWPLLLNLYSKLLPGLTIEQWIEHHDVLALGIDPRRFVSFGIIKGFLRRVHRWPILVDRHLLDHPESRRKVEFDKSTHVSSLTLSTNAARDSAFTLHSQGSNTSLASPSQTPSIKSPRRIKGSLSKSLTSAEHPSLSSRRMLKPSMKINEQERRLDEDLVRYLDGSHHTDEMQVYFGMGWKELEKVLGVEGKRGIVLVLR